MSQSELISREAAVAIIERRRQEQLVLRNHAADRRDDHYYSVHDCQLALLNLLEQLVCALPAQVSREEEIACPTHRRP